MIYWKPFAWDIEKQGDKYIVGKWTTTAMRLSADGSLGIGSTRQAIEQHEFQTLEWAEVMLNFCRGLESQPVTYSFTNSNINTNGKFSTALDWKVTNHSVVTIGHGGELLKIDLPFIVWQWIKLSKVSRFMKALMWGERGQA